MASTFEAALRVLLRGSPRAVRGELAGRVVAALGEPVDTGIPALTRLVPTAARVAEAGAACLVALGASPRRAEVIARVARAVSDGTLRLDPCADLADTRRALADLAGDRVASTVVMRALDWPDASPLRTARYGMPPASRPPEHCAFERSAGASGGPMRPCISGYETRHPARSPARHALKTGRGVPLGPCSRRARLDGAPPPAL